MTILLVALFGWCCGVACWYLWTLGMPLINPLAVQLAGIFAIWGIVLPLAWWQKWRYR